MKFWQKCGLKGGMAAERFVREYLGEPPTRKKKADYIRSAVYKAPSFISGGKI